MSQDQDRLLASLARREWLVDGILSPLVIPFVNFLRTQRYSESTVRIYLKGLAHFAYWANGQGFGLPDINETLVARFSRHHVRFCKCPPPRTCHLHHVYPPLRHLLAFMRQAGYIGDDPLPTPIVGELKEFRQFMVRTCGFANTTVSNQLRHIKDFLSRRFGTDQIDISCLISSDVDDCIAAYSKRWRPSSMRVIRSSLKSYFRFCSLRGDQVQPLEAALPILPDYTNVTLPKTLTDTQLDSFLRAFDLKRSIGQRDYAIARCLVDLGLRGNEVAGLSLDSLDWHSGIVTVAHRKGGRVLQLPLPRQTGEAIARYLRDGRPVTSNRALFVRHEAPIGKPLCTPGIRSAMRYAFQRCGLGEQFCNTHVFRHTAAIRLQRAGVSLKEIADVLGHQSLQTTTRYARVDLLGLRAVALPWPGQQS